jgi:superfamily II DNA helicase RecQ
VEENNDDRLVEERNDDKVVEEQLCTQDDIVFIRNVLRQSKGWEDFKSEEQMRGILNATLTQENLLIILPTGGGKSLIYEMALRCRSLLTNISTYGFLVVPTNCIKGQVMKSIIDGGIRVETFRADLDVFEKPLLKIDPTLVIVQPMMFSELLFWAVIKKRQPSFVCIDECLVLYHVPPGYFQLLCLHVRSQDCLML